MGYQTESPKKNQKNQLCSVQMLNNKVQHPRGSKLLRFAHQSQDKAVKLIYILVLQRAFKKVSSTSSLQRCSIS